MVDILRTLKNVMDAHGAWLFGGAVAAGLVARRAARKRSSFDADWFQVACYGCGRSGFSDEFTAVTAPDGRDAYRCVRCDRPDLFRQAEGAEYDYDEYGFITYPSAERLVAKILMDDPHDYEVDDHLLIVDGTIVEVGGNSQMEHFEKEDFWDNCDEYMIIVIKSVDPYTFKIIDFIQSEPVSHGAETINPEIILMQAILPDGTVAETSIDHVDQLSWPGHLLDESVAKGGSMAGRFEGIEMPAGSGHHCVVWSDPDATESNAEASRLAGQPVFGTAVVYSVYGGGSFAAEATNPCQHCEGAAGFPREFYYEPDRIDMVPCGTCLTQGRCPGCMEIYTGLSRDNTPEDVFFGPGCDRCGYSESDAREARKTARRWADLVDNPAATRFMAEGSPLPKPKTGLFSRKPKLVKVSLECRPGDPTFSEVQHRLAEGGYMMLPHDETFSERVWVTLVSGDDATGVGYINNIPINPKYELGQLIEWDMGDVSIIEDATPESLAMMGISEDVRDAEDYGVGAVWMADTYDSSKHGNLLPMGSVKRFLASMPVSQKFHVDFVKSNGEIRSMDAVLTKPYDPDSRTADVLEITDTGGKAFKRFRVDRVFVLYRV